MTTKTTDLKPSILVVYSPSHQEDISSITKSLEALGLSVIPIKSDQIPTDFTTIKAAYLSEVNQKILDACSKNNVLTFSGYRELVSEGNASIAIINEGGKPKPMLNKTRLNSENKLELLVSLSSVSLVVE